MHSACLPYHVTHVQELQSLVSGLVGARIPEDQPLMEAGLDSIGAVELRNAVAARFGVELPATVTFDYPSPAALGRFVAQQLGGSAPAAAWDSPAHAGQVPQQGWHHEPPRRQQSASLDEAIARQIVATVSELLGFDVPTDQVTGPAPGTVARYAIRNQLLWPCTRLFPGLMSTGNLNMRC